jgi:hypothetical protein
MSTVSGSFGRRELCCVRVMVFLCLFSKPLGSLQFQKCCQSNSKKLNFFFSKCARDLIFFVAVEQRLHFYFGFSKILLDCIRTPVSPRTGKTVFDGSIITLIRTTFRMKTELGIASSVIYEKIFLHLILLSRCFE